MPKPYFMSLLITIIKVANTHVAISQSQRMDAELMDEQIKLKKNIELYERSINRYSKLLKKVVPKQNGNV